MRTEEPKKEPRTMEINELKSSVHNMAKAKGWWDPKTNEEMDAEAKLARIAVEHVELSDKLEAARVGKVFAMRAIPLPSIESMSPRQIALLSKIALVHSELSEATEAVMLNRPDECEIDGKPEGLVVELADAVIRIFDMSGGFLLDIFGAIMRKVAYNKTRPMKHGGKRA